MSAEITTTGLTQYEIRGESHPEVMAAFAEFLSDKGEDWTIHSLTFAHWSECDARLSFIFEEWGSR